VSASVSCPVSVFVVSEQDPPGHKKFPVSVKVKYLICYFPVVWFDKKIQTIKGTIQKNQIKESEISFECCKIFKPKEIPKFI